MVQRAHTVTHHLDVVDTRTVEGSIVRIYNAAGFEFMTLKSDIVSTQFDSLFGEKLVGTRHAEDGRLYAILKDDDCTREEPVDLFPFADVQVGPSFYLLVRWSNWTWPCRSMVSHQWSSGCIRSRTCLYRSTRTRHRTTRGCVSASPLYNDGRG